MKIGILTYHRSHNFGALLQAIGLRKHLEDKGHEAYFVDYWPEYHRKMYKVFHSLYAPRLSLRARISGLIQDIYLSPLKSRRIKKFRDFINLYIAPYCRPVSDSFDCIICGSDQIWRKQAGLGGKYNPTYFGGGNLKAGFYISYAGSMGELKITKEDIDTLKDLFSNFRSISVREEKLAKTLLSQNIVKELCVVADPTILVGTKIWEDFIGDAPSSVGGRYALYYKLMYDSFNDEDIKQYTKDHSLKLITLEGNIRREDYFNGSLTNADPLEMLRLIAHADYVFTSSYHGLVFSLLFKRQVACAFKENKARAQSLLSFLGISERMIEKSQPIPSSLIDYNMVGLRLTELSKASQDWLDGNLSSGQ